MLRWLLFRARGQAYFQLWCYVVLFSVVDEDDDDRN